MSSPQKQSIPYRSYQTHQQLVQEAHEIRDKWIPMVNQVDQIQRKPDFKQEPSRKSPSKSSNGSWVFPTRPLNLDASDSSELSSPTSFMEDSSRAGRTQLERFDSGFTSSKFRNISISSTSLSSEDPIGSMHLPPASTSTIQPSKEGQPTNPQTIVVTLNQFKEDEIPKWGSWMKRIQWVHEMGKGIHLRITSSFQDLLKMIRSSIYGMALASVDVPNEDFFSWSQTHKSVDRLWNAAQPIPDFVMFAYGVIMWESPLKTTFFITVLTWAILSERFIFFSYLIFLLTLFYHGISDDQIHDLMGMSCLHRDAQIEPSFADSSRAQFLEHRKKRWGSPWSILSAFTGAPSSHCSEQLNPVLHAAIHPDQVWQSLKDQVLAQVQLQLRDASDLVEKFNSFMSWHHPKATAWMLGLVTMGLTGFYFVSYDWIVKGSALSMEAYVFISVPLQSKFPRYRRLFSPLHLILWPFPTVSERAVLELSKSSQPITSRLQINGNNEEATSAAACPLLQCSARVTESPQAQDQIIPQHQNSKYLQSSESSATSLPLSQYEFSTWWNDQRGKIVLLPTLHELHFIGTRSFTSSKRNIQFKTALNSIIRMKKNVTKEYLFIKNAQLVLTLESGKSLIFHHVSNLDECFSVLAALSSDPKRRWRVSGA